MEQVVENETSEIVVLWQIHVLIGTSHIETIEYKTHLVQEFHHDYIARG